MAEKTPRNVRNFWLEVEVDGRKEKIACGPVNKQGGLTLTLKQRNKGKIDEVMTIDCFAEVDDSQGAISLYTVAHDDANRCVLYNITER